MEDAREVVRTRRDDELNADEDEDVLVPMLSSGGAGLQELDEAVLCGGHADRRIEQRSDEDHGGGGSAAGERLSGQTGQDRSGSPEPGGEVAEREDRGPGDGVAAAQPGLPRHGIVHGGSKRRKLIGSLLAWRVPNTINRTPTTIRRHARWWT